VRRGGKKRDPTVWGGEDLKKKEKGKKSEVGIVVRYRHKDKASREGKKAGSSPRAEEASENHVIDFLNYGEKNQGGTWVKPESGTVRLRRRVISSGMERRGRQPG